MQFNLLSFYSSIRRSSDLTWCDVRMIDMWCARPHSIDITEQFLLSMLEEDNHQHDVQWKSPCYSQGSQQSRYNCKYLRRIQNQLCNEEKDFFLLTVWSPLHSEREIFVSQRRTFLKNIWSTGISPQSEWLSTKQSHPYSLASRFHPWRMEDSVAKGFWFEVILCISFHWRFVMKGSMRLEIWTSNWSFSLRDLLV